MKNHCYSGIISILLGMLVVPLFGQNGMFVSIFEYPEPLVFSKERHFKNGRSSSMTLLVSCNFDNDGDDDDDEIDEDDHFRRWEIFVNAEGNLSSNSHTIPLSSIWLKAKPNVHFRSNGKVVLSTRFKKLAQTKPSFIYSNNSMLEIKLKAPNGEDFLKPAGVYFSEIYFTVMMD